MAGAYVGVGSTVTFNSGGTTQSITSDSNLPSGHAAGNLMVALIKSNAATARPDYTLTGWTQRARITAFGPTEGVLEVWTKVATSNTRADDLPIEVVFSAAPTGSSITRIMVFEVSGASTVESATAEAFGTGNTDPDQSANLSVNPPVFIMQFAAQISTTGTIPISTANGFTLVGTDTSTPTSGLAYKSGSLGDQPMPAWLNTNATVNTLAITLVLSDGLKRPYPRTVFF